MFIDYILCQLVLRKYRVTAMKFIGYRAPASRGGHNYQQYTIVIIFKKSYQNDCRFSISYL